MDEQIKRSLEKLDLIEMNMIELTRQRDYYKNLYLELLTETESVENTRAFKNQLKQEK
jgi:uncharacterized protein involved in exopolysaccharide biosynthesis